MFKVRCITVFGGGDHPPEEVADVLRKLKESVSGDATEVQMTRYTSTVVSDPDQKPEQALIDAARAFESTTSAAGVAPVSLGAIRSREVVRDPDFLVRLVTETSHAFVSVAWQHDWGHPEAIRLANAMFAMEEHKPGTNFRFGVSFHCEDKFIPFFPASSCTPSADGAPPLCFSVGLENSALLHRAVADCDPRSLDPLNEIQCQIKRVLGEALTPIERACVSAAERLGIEYKGIDTSIAPDLRGTIHDMAACVSLEGTLPPFQAGTVAKIDAITSALRNVPGVTVTGYAGVMLPLLENESLVEASKRGELTVDKLLLYSGVCGVGIDVVPLAGGRDAVAREAAERRLAGLILDVAAISRRQSKALSVRVLPCIGRGAGEATTFESPYLINGVAM